MGDRLEIFESKREPVSKGWSWMVCINGIQAATCSKEKRANDEFKQDVTLMLMCKDKITGLIVNYALKVNDIDWLRNEVNAVWNNPKYAVPNTGNQDFDENAKLKKINEELAKGYEANKSDLEKYFLQKYGGGSFDLYKAKDENLDNWDKLETGTDPLSENPTLLKVNKIPCP